jgi:hypothetical protein
MHKKQTGPNATGPEQSLNDLNAMLDGCASSGHQMPDDRDHGKDQKKMDQAARDMESCETQNPKHEQNDTDKQKHVSTPKAKFH